MGLLASVLVSSVDSSEGELVETPCFDADGFGVFWFPGCEDIVGKGVATKEMGDSVVPIWSDGEGSPTAVMPSGVGVDVAFSDVRPSFFFRSSRPLAMKGILELSKRLKKRTPTERIVTMIKKNLSLPVLGNFDRRLLDGLREGGRLPS